MQLKKLYQVGLYELTEAQGQDFLDKLKGEEPEEQPVTQDIPKEPTITKKQMGAIHAISSENGVKTRRKGARSYKQSRMEERIAARIFHAKKLAK